MTQMFSAEFPEPPSAGAILRVLVGYIVGWLVRGWAFTWRVRLVHAESFDERSGEPMVFAFWHGQQLGLLAARRPRRLVTLVSLSKDGQLQAGVMRALGLDVVRGSSSRAASRGLVGVLRRVNTGASAAFAVDGPRGPLRRAKPGAQRVAARTGAALIPVAMAAERYTTLKAWDEFEIPWPFTRVAVAFGSSIVNASRPGTLDELSQAIEQARSRARSALSGTARSAAKALLSAPSDTKRTQP